MNEQLQELLCDYLEGEISAEKRKQVEELLASDPELRRTLAEMQQERAAMRELPVEAAPQNVRDAIREQIERPAAIPMFSSARLMRVAAMLLMAAGAGLAIWAVLPSNEPRQMAMETRERPYASMAPTGATAESELKTAVDVQTSARPEGALAMNARAVMVVRASDVPAAERQIGSFLASNNIAYVNASDRSADAFGGGVAMGGPAPATATPATPAMPSAPAVITAPEAAVTAAPAPMPAAVRSRAAKSTGFAAEAPLAEKPAEKQLAGAVAKAEREVAADKDSMASVTTSNAATIAAVTRPFYGGGQLTMRNMNQDQLRFIRENVYNMADGKKMRVAGESPEVAQVAAAQAQMRGQLQRKAPYVPQQQLDAMRRDVRSEQLMKESAPRDEALYDLTIVVEPADGLPRAAAAATLPSSRPR